tara:strand:+ start:101288 stop:103933 length:2646 start_codon:yes stop_codon:yes gene_type:complete
MKPKHVLMLLCLLALKGFVWTQTTPKEKRKVTAAKHVAGSFHATVFLRKHCLACHGKGNESGELRLDTLSMDFQSPRVVSTWTEVLGAVNGHEMPPSDQPQPPPGDVARFVQWLESEIARSELLRRSSRVVLRRINRAEYDNTIRDLIGVDLSLSSFFPEDTSAGGFDNVGDALTMSPLQMELYYTAAREILDHALIDADWIDGRLSYPAPPKQIRWRFEPEENTEGMDKHRVSRGGQIMLLNRGDNAVENGFTRIHHDAWNRWLGIRPFEVPEQGEYLVRVRAAGRVPTRADVVESARGLLEERHRLASDEEASSSGYAKDWISEQLDHFATDGIYDYGPPRMKISLALGGAPSDSTEFDVDALELEPKIYEWPVHFAKAQADVRLTYAYSVPGMDENFWMRERDEFARPELLIDWIELEGPVYSDWPPASHTNLLFQSQQANPTVRDYARDVLERFMFRAYRRPVAPEEIDKKLVLFDKARRDEASFIEAIKVPFAAVLSSPNFLYLVESVASESVASEAAALESVASQASGRRLTDYELASRLSYFLWSSMPDEELFDTVAKDSFKDPEIMMAQVSRMLADSKSDALVKNFAGQWLGLREIGSNPPVESLYPKYDRHLEISMVKETESFFAEFLRHDLDARLLIKSDFVTINQRLARFYGIEGVVGDEFRRVQVPPDSHRGGLITQASIHCITSNGTRTSPVKRGVWISKTLLGTDPGLPVANVGEIPTKVPGIDKATVRQRLAIHREHHSCARCHDKIDPLGIALENFNACGEWREFEGVGRSGRVEPGTPRIDVTATMPDGDRFVGVDGLQSRLIKNDEPFLHALASQMATYALGRRLGISDRAFVRELVREMKDNGYTLRSLIEAIVSSKTFASK